MLEAVKVKICGITNLEDALAAVKAGCDALGFVFYRKSPRYISPESAAAIIRRLPKRVLKAGVFVNARASRINAVARLCKIDLLQLHGDESVEFCRKFPAYRVVKAFRVGRKLILKAVSEYNTYAWLFDAFTAHRYGGTGKCFDWELLKNPGRFKKPVFLSGGLDAANVSRAIRIVRPAWVDASSSLEESPGRKDPQKVREFIAIVKER